MTDVFISYASEDRKRAQMLAEALETRGLSVWWDRNIVTGQSYDSAIEHELEAAKSVVVLWSKHSVVSEWVKNEAAVGVERGVLVPALIDPIKPPLEFRRKQTADLIGWDGDTGNVGFNAVCRGVAALVARDRPSQQDVVPVHEPRLAEETPRLTLDVTKRLKRRAFFSSGVALLILAILGLWYWDAFYRPHTDYYANVIRRWGLPEGVGRLTDEQIKHRNVALAFIQHGRWGPVKEIRAVDNRGAYRPLVSIPPFSLALLNPLLEKEEYQGVVRVTFERDANGQILRQNAYNRADRLLYALLYVQPDVAKYQLGAFSKVVTESGITQIKIVRPETGPEAGLEKELLWLDSIGAPKPDRDGSFGYRSTFNELGLPVEWSGLGSDGQPPDRVGKAKTVYKYDGQGNMTQFMYFGANGQPVLHPTTGSAETKLRYDQQGNITELAFFGTDGQLITSKRLGIAGRTLAYDDSGNYVGGTFFGPDRQLVRGPGGFAKETVVWDEKGSALSSVFGPDGKPTALFGRVITSKTVWDERGFPAEEVYFDENNRPVRDMVGCAKNKLGPVHTKAAHRR